MTAIHTCADSDNAFHQAAMLVAERMVDATTTNRHATLVLPGGGTVRTFLRHLSTHPLDWSCIRVILADERWVDADHPDSNESLLRRLLPTGTSVTGLKTGATEPAAAVAEVSGHLRPLGPPFDVVFLGVGSDGHVASLFPHGPELEASGVVVASHPPAAPHPRLSLTLPALLACGLLVTVMTDDKRAVLAQALENGPAAAMPIRLLLRQEQTPFALFTH